MLPLSGLRNFYFLPHFHDMRCGYSCIMEVIRMSYHRNPYKGDVFSLCLKKEDAAEKKWASRFVGCWKDERTAEEIVDELRSRTFNRDIEL